MRQTARSRAIIALAILPIFLFYAILIIELVNVPCQDDYDALLKFANNLTRLRTASEKFLYFLSAQHNEYKLFFERALVWLQMDLMPQVNFGFLCLVGDAFVLLLAVVLWKMFEPDHTGRTTRLALYLPALLLLFQLQYYETLNWAMAVLQNMPVLFFALLAIYLLPRPGRRAFYGASLCLLLAISSSGNGLVLVPVGLLILGISRRYARAVLWLVMSSFWLAIYAYHYNELSSQSPVHPSIFTAILDVRPLYALAFLGAAVRQVQHQLPIVLGVALCLFFAYLIRRGYTRKNPAVVYSVLFLVITALGVAGMRSDFGISQSLSSRYNIYSALMLIFAWFGFVEEFPELLRLPLRRNRIFVPVFLITLLFCVTEDALGWRDLIRRDHLLLHDMRVYEHTAEFGEPRGPVLPLPNQGPTLDKLDTLAHDVLGQAITLHTYTPRTY